MTKMWKKKDFYYQKMPNSPSSEQIQVKAFIYEKKSLNSGV